MAPTGVWALTLELFSQLRQGPPDRGPDQWPAILRRRVLIPETVDIFARHPRGRIDVLRRKRLAGEIVRCCLRRKGKACRSGHADADLAHDAGGYAQRDRN